MRMCGVSLHYLIFPFINQRANCARTNLIFDRPAELARNATSCKHKDTIYSMINFQTLQIFMECLDDLKKKNRCKMTKIRFNMYKRKIIIQKMFYN